MSPSDILRRHRGIERGDFAGDLPAEEIAKIIQNRVQLYLDENR